MTASVPAAVRATFEARARSIPAELARAADVAIDWPELAPGASVVVTGIGASEGPARYLALLLQLAGRRASFAPLSAFVCDRPAALGDALVVFSQGLSPNARLAIARAGEHRASLLFTSVVAARAIAEVRGSVEQFEQSGGRVIVLPPTEESGTFTRLVGPAVALFAAARLAASLGAPIASPLLARVPEIVASAADRAEAAARSLPPLALHRRIALVSAGAWSDGARGLQCKWLEGLGAPEPPLWDVLQIAHGPFQQFFDEEVTLVALAHEGAEAERDLFDRLEAMVVPGRHAVLRLASALPPPLGVLDHDAQWTALLVRALGERSKDLAAAGDRDAPLYGLGRSR